MSSKAIYCAFFILASVVLAVLAVDPPASKVSCLNAVAVNLTIKEIEGEWFEIQRKNSSGTFDSGYQCLKIKFNTGNTTTGTVEISRRHDKDKKLEKEEKSSVPFTLSDNHTINFEFNNVSLSIKILAKPSTFVVSCGFANQDTANAQAWILSKTRTLKDEEKKAVKATVQNFSDFDTLEDIEQDEKKCNGAGSVVPVVSVLALTLFTVLKAF